MRRFLFVGLILFTVGCQAPPQRPAVPLLPDDTPPQPFVVLAARARSQAMSALEAYYVDRWAEVEDAARGLEQTAQYLIKAEDVPAKHKDTLATLSADLGKLAKELRESASAKNADKANEVLGKINAKVRSMRLSD